MTPEELGELLAVGHEVLAVEFKAPGKRNDAAFFAKVVRACIGMSNRRDGGLIAIGVDEIDHRPVATGLSDEELATWRFDDVLGALSSYADPPVDLEVETVEYEGAQCVVLHVKEFDDIPTLCKRDYPGTLRDGACYVRSRRKPETIEVPTQADMRDLLDLATEKRLRRMLRMIISAGGMVVAQQGQPTDDELFRNQLGGFGADP